MEMRDETQPREAKCVPGVTEANAPTLTEVKPRLRSSIIVRPLSEIESRAICWLWPHRIARGKVSIIAGHPGLGKSQLTAMLAAVVTTGGRWPVDGTPCERGSVILLNAEDDASDTIRPRLEAAGADVSRIEIIEAVSMGFCTDGLQRTRAFNLKTDLEALDTMLSERPDNTLLVIDPVTAYLSGVDTHVNADVRAILAPLGELAARHSLAVVCVTHLNKGGPGKAGAGEAMLRVTGSLAFVAASRAAYIVTRDADHPDRRLFLPSKTNIAKDDMPGLAFTIESCFLPGDVETCRVAWLPDPVTITADEAMAATTPNANPATQSESADAAEWLKEMLTEAGGEMSKSDVMNAAKDAGYKERTVYRVRRAAGISTTSAGFGKDKRSIWRLDEGASEPPNPASYAASDVGTNGKNGNPDGCAEGASNE